MKENKISGKIVKAYLDVIIRIINYFITKKRNIFLIIIRRILSTLKAQMIYAIEEGNWSIDWDGKYITGNLNKLGLIKSELASPYFARNKIIHYGSINCLISNEKLRLPHKSNKIVLTWFHLAPSDNSFKFINILKKKVDFIHTSNNITKKKLVELGFNKNRIKVIPLGIDLSNFRAYNNNERSKIKAKLKLPLDKFIIGSFQKDGVGWEEGLEPKLVKGPDILCDVLEKINETLDIHIILTGPARGYVKNRLNKSGIPYTYVFLENYFDIVKYYNALDLYIITSRAEGGPKALLESMATGIPIVSTDVGMVPDLIENKINGFIVNADDSDKLSYYSIKILKDKKLSNKFSKHNLKLIKKYSWEKISKLYYNKMYKKFLIDN